MEYYQICSHNKHKRRKCGSGSDGDEKNSKDKKKDKYESDENAHRGGGEKVYATGNHIYFRDKVNDGSIDKLVNLIDEKNRDFEKAVRNNPLIASAKPTPLFLHISSYGGHILPAFRAIDKIISSEIPVNTIVDGWVASAGAMMSIVGNTRYMTPSGYMLIHQLSGGCFGKYNEIVDDFENVKQLEEDILQLFMDHTIMKKKELEKYFKHDLWWKFDKCKKLGMVDEEWSGNDL